MEPKDSVVLDFNSAAKQATATAAASELKALLDVYDRLIALLRETDNDGLDMLTDGFVRSVVRCREALAVGVDAETGPLLVKEMRVGLREFPLTLRSLLPGLGPRLSESLEHKLKIQFSKY